MPDKLPDLSQSLQKADPGFLRIVFELWGMEPGQSDEGKAAGREYLLGQVPSLLEAGRAVEIVETLSGEARQALDDLLHNQGKLPWPMFTRRYGAVREMGAGRRDRLQPHKNPASPAEILWYRALVRRDFLDTPDGPQEFAYIPGDLLELLPGPPRDQKAPPGRPASPSERAHVIPANDHILDHACTLLAALRLGLVLEAVEFTRASWDYSFPSNPNPNALQPLLSAAELLESTSGLPQPETTRRFLELPRDKALGYLARAWQHSSTFNELRLLPGLAFEGEWQNDPLRARYAILELLAGVPHNTWWSLTAFIAALKQKQPDFQRPAGDYDSWFIRDQLSDEYLRGFAHWDAVDGALVRFLICGPMHWLGILDLAAPAEGAGPTAFRFSRWGEALLSGAPPVGLEAEDDSFLISSDARLRAPRLVPRAARYLVARFCIWESASEDAYSYRLTAASLARARGQGLRVGHLLSLLRRHALTVPPSLAKALDRWEEHGSEARLERALILRLRSPEMLQALRNSRAARYLGDPLGPTTVIVKPGAGEKVIAALAEMGYIGEIE
jgi:Helicase conserved C-terminal domain